MEKFHNFYFVLLFLKNDIHKIIQIQNLFLGSNKVENSEPQANYVYSSNPVEQLTSNSLYANQATSTRRQDIGNYTLCMLTNQLALGDKI